jgi:hypothetical protein
MSCPLYVAASFPAHVPSTEYEEGDIVSQSGATFIAVVPIPSSVDPFTDEWINTRQIPYIIRREAWTALSGEVYLKFDVVEYSGNFYMARRNHTNSGI